MKKLFVVIVMVVFSVVCQGKEENIRIGNDLIAVWKFDDISPMFEISGIYARNNRIEIRSIRGYYQKDKMSILAVTYSDQKKAFLITFQMKSSDMVRAIFLDTNSEDFVNYAKDMAQKAYPNVKIGEKPTVICDDLSGISFDTIN